VAVDRKAELLATVSEVLRRHLWPQTIDVTFDRRLSDIGVTSLARIEIIVEVERHFSVVFPDDSLGDQTFDTITNIWNKLSSLL
jgi:acyl carrier protein